jgi:Winged helix-turn helix
MRGRRPRPIPIDPADLETLHQVARSESLPWYQVRRARIVLANARGLSNGTAAFQMQCDEATVWRTCRLYERGGLTKLLAPSHRPGRPGRFSPPPAGSDHPAGLPRACGQGPSHHALV